MTTKTFKIQTTITTSIVVDYEFFQEEIEKARLWATDEEKAKNVHPMSLKLIREGASDDEILNMILKHSTSILFKDELKKNSNVNAALYFKGFQVNTKVNDPCAV